MILLEEQDIQKNWDYSKALVSIMCITFNQEQFISQCIDSMLIQKTDFPFEIIIHDDASTDKTAQIIKEYKIKFPNIIRPIYEKQNQYSKHDGSIRRILDNCSKGKYIANCEGDDYWCDENKLQKQFDFLEKNEDYFAVGHLTRTIDSDGNEINSFVTTKSGEYTLQDNNEWQLFAHFSSYFFRNYIDYIDTNNYLEFLQLKCPGDRSLPILFFQFGKIYVLPFIGSTYRFQSSINSFTSKSSNFNIYNLWEETYSLSMYAQSKGLNVNYKKREQYLIGIALMNYIRKKDIVSYNKIRNTRHSKFIIDCVKSVPIFMIKIREILTGKKYEW